jgi:hypothetical protein
VLSQESVTAMQAEQVAVPDPYTLGSHWGLGWFLMTWDGRRVYGHDGSTLGQGGFLRVLPDEGLSVSLLTNGGKGPRDLFAELYAELFAELAGVRMPAWPEPTPGATIDDPARFTGRYAREGVEMTISEQPDGLELLLRPTGELFKDMPDPKPMRLVPHEGEVLVGKGPDDEAWMPAVFFDLDGERYVHFGARATRRVSTEL